MQTDVQGGSQTNTELTDWIGDWLCREIGMERGQLQPTTTFAQYGMDSIQAMMLVGDLEEHLRRRLAPTLAWDYPTLETLAAHLAQG